MSLARSHPEYCTDDFNAVESLNVSRSSISPGMISHRRIAPAISHEAIDSATHVRELMKATMRVGEHYACLSGSSKPVLLKPGAEYLNALYGFTLHDVVIVEKVEQFHVAVTGNSFPLFRYIVKTSLADRNGMIIGTGIGECSSYEEKYRYQEKPVTCPQCGKPAIRYDAVAAKPFYCWKKRGGCGAKFTADQLHRGKEVNTHIYDQVNTILKMAKKRSYVDATLTATGTSGLFTQDLETRQK